ncbi:hypothetical protein GCM10010222_19940 [Streptomyces tanashiensis]|nr:hypothetical protein GCM10010222_19940 [Streptomyces tanashiensis]
MVGVATGDEDGVVADGEGVEVHDTAVDDHTSRDLLPGGAVEADPCEGSEVLGEYLDQGGELVRERTGAGPPRAVENAFARVRRPQPEQGRSGPHRSVDLLRKELRRGGGV